MPRTITTGVLAQVTATSAEFVHLIELDFSTGTIYLSTGSTDVTTGGNTYVAIGGVLSVNAIPETGDISQSQIELTVSGVNTTIIAALLTSFAVNYGVVISRVYFDSSYSVISTPLVLFSGLMNGGMEIREKRPTNDSTLPTCEVTLRCSSRLANLDEQRSIQCNVFSHDFWYPGDRLFELAQQISYKPITWTGAQIKQ